MATLKEQWAGISTELAMADYGAAQTWTALSTYTLVELRIRMANSGAAYTGDLIIDLYTVSGGEPDTKIVTLATVDVSGWGSIQTWRIITGLSQLITSGVEYAYVMNLNPLRDGSHYIRWSGKNGYSGGTGYQENTDEVYTNAGIDFHFANYGNPAATPTKATNPTPANSATGVDFSGLVLDWDDGGGTDTFDVYIGPSGGLVQVASAIISTTYTVSIGDVPTEQVIYWRVDATNASGTTTGDTWNFDARPVAATTPSPSDAADDVTLDQATIVWEDGGNTDTYDVYYGDTSGNLTLVSSGQAGLSFTISGITSGSPFDYLITRYWRIDAVNVFGTTTGGEWSFISIEFDQIRVSYRLISGGNGQGPYASTPGVQGTDWEYTGESNMTTIKKLIAAANNTIWIEDI